MRYKEAAIAVVVAVMLGTASLFGGPVAPALATHDPDAKQVTNQQFLKEDDEITEIGSIEFSAKSAVLFQEGTLTIEILQNGTLVDSETMSAFKLTPTYTKQEVDFGTEVNGSFEVLIEYWGTGMVEVIDVEVLNGTETAAENENNNSEETDNTSTAEEQQINNVIERKSFALAEDESQDIEVVEFVARSAILFQKGTLTVAIVQDDEIQDSFSMSARNLTPVVKDFEATFDVEVIGDFEVVFMYEGIGTVQVNSIAVPGQTATAGDDDDDTTGPSGTVLLTVNAIDEAGNEITGMAIGIYQGTEATGDPDFVGFTSETFELEAGDYVVAVSDFGNNAFLRWDDSTQDRTREATLTEDETFTAVYSTDVISPPADNTDNTTPPDNTEDSTTPPPSVGSGTITVYAHRIPSEHWGPTFTGANAQMFFVVYNSALDIVASGFYDENGNTVTGLNDGETYFVSPTDCNTCHDDPHDVVFRHWENDSTERQRPVTTGMSVTAFYEFVPH